MIYKATEIKITKTKLVIGVPELSGWTEAFWRTICL